MEKNPAFLYRFYQKAVTQTCQSGGHGKEKPFKEQLNCYIGSEIKEELFLRSGWE